jgi:hypothetical protein
MDAAVHAEAQMTAKTRAMVSLPDHLPPSTEEEGEVQSLNEVLADHVKRVGK